MITISSETEEINVNDRTTVPTMVRSSERKKKEKRSCLPDLSFITSNKLL